MPSVGSFSRGPVVHQPRLSPSFVQQQYRAAPHQRLGPRMLPQQSLTTRQHRKAPLVHEGRIRQQYIQQKQLRQHVQGQRLQQHTSTIYTQRRMQDQGKHHRRHRRRQRGFTYFYAGWWYAYPWWEESYSDYGYWSRVCAYRWGYRTRGWYRCMAYYGFY